MSFLYSIIVAVGSNALALYGLTYFIHDIKFTGGITFFIVGAILLAFINGILKPILKILSLPLVILTAGLFLIVINGLTLWLLSYLLEVAKFQDLSLSFPNFSTYVIGAIVFGIINWLIHLFFK